jgi:hypothetical protein
MLAATLLAVAVAPELINGGGIDWSVIKESGTVALGYWLLSTFKDYKDPTVPNTNNPQG